MARHTCAVSRIVEPIYEMGSLAPVSQVEIGWLSRCECGWVGYQTSEREVAIDQWKTHRDLVWSPEEIAARRAETRRRVDKILEEFII